MNIEKIGQNITVEEGKMLRQKIYEKAREFMPNSSLPGELDPESGSLTIFNSNSEQTRNSVIGVVRRYLDRISDLMVDEKDKKGLEKFKEYLKSL